SASSASSRRTIARRLESANLVGMAHLRTVATRAAIIPKEATNERKLRAAGSSSATLRRYRGGIGSHRWVGGQAARGSRAKSGLTGGRARNQSERVHRAQDRKSTRLNSSHQI